jgi:glycosyltransferase involved in cell wall biosynthesis
MKENGSSKIGIFIYKYGLANSPSLVNTGKALSEAGFRVDYFLYECPAGDVRFDNPGISVFTLDKEVEERDLSWFVKKILPELPRQLVGDFYYGNKGPRIFYEQRFKMVEKELLSVSALAARKAGEIIGDEPYRCFIAVEPGGLMVASGLSRTLNVPLIYYNLELGMQEEGDSNLIWRVFNKYERLLNRRAVATIVQDSERARILAERNGVPISSILTVPVSAIGPIYDKKTDWLRKRLGLSPDDRIVLYAGYITDWAMCVEMAEAAQRWPEGRVLVLHSHSIQDKRYLKKLRRYVGERVKLSLESLPYEDLPTLLASADIGIALYKGFGRNFTLIGSASGKIAYYLKCGLPVISNNYPSIKEVLEGYGCGVCVDSAEQINTAIEKILANYEPMRKKAFYCYEERYMFSKQFVKVIDFINGLGSGSINPGMVNK